MFFTSTRSKWSSVALAAMLFLSKQSNAQVEQSGRMEVTIHADNEGFSVVPVDTAGLILHRSYSTPNDNQMELVRVDTSLNQVWRGFLALPKTLLFVKSKASEGKVYFFFRNLAVSSKNFHIYAVSVKDGTYRSFIVKNLIQFNPSEFLVSKQAILIGGYFNFRPIVLYYSMQEQRSRMLPGFLNEPGELTQIKTYDDGNVDVIVSAKNASRKKCLWIRHFDNAGDLIQTVVIEPDEGKNIIFGRAARMANDNQVIAGVFGRNGEFSRGIFVAEVNPYGEYIIRYYNFADLQNFFHYMKAKREKRVKERIERRRIKGKKTKFNYRLLVHELVPYGNQFIMLGEAFYPTYSTRQSFATLPSSANISPWNYGINSRNFYNTPYNAQTVFDGFQYTHAVAIGFDTNANLVWDNSFEINGIKSFQLEQFVKIVPSGDKISLLYLFANAIRSKIIKGNDVLEGVVQDSMTATDKLKTRIQSSRLEYWFGNHLLVYGIQESKDNPHAAVRRVFYINKISVK